MTELGNIVILGKRWLSSGAGIGTYHASRFIFLKRLRISAARFLIKST
jgi:hypothetical protein